MRKPKPLAILMTYASPDSENRLKTQLAAVISMGFEVHTLGFGSSTLPGVAKHIEIPAKLGVASSIKKVITHIFLKPQNRFHSLRVPKSVYSNLASYKYDLVVAHDIELLPLILNSELGSQSFKDSIKHVDLHELHDFNSPVTGFLKVAWILLGFRLRPYHDWLLSHLKSERLDIATVVNRRIGDWYVSNGYLDNFSVVRNCAPYSSLGLELRGNRSIKFLYHGKFDAKRGLDNLLVLASMLNPGDTMNFLLTGNPRQIQRFRTRALRNSSNVFFHESVPMAQVSKRISEFDVEVIYFEPKTRNLSLTLPNKFFEAIQGRLAILSGPSPELADHVSELGLGVSANNWDIGELGSLAKTLDRTHVDEMRQCAHAASSKVNSAQESEILKALWRVALRGDY